jgi:hypothetical protein
MARLPPSSAGAELSCNDASLCYNQEAITRGIIGLGIGKIDHSINQSINQSISEDLYSLNHLSHFYKKKNKTWNVE